MSFLAARRVNTYIRMQRSNRGRIVSISLAPIVPLKSMLLGSPTGKQVERMALVLSSDKCDFLSEMSVSEIQEILSFDQAFNLLKGLLRFLDSMISDK